MDDIPRLSEAVYVGLCRKVGSPTEVRIRREVMDTEEFFCIMRSYDRMLSGSEREGFRLSTSDEDCMYWPPNHKVICDLSQVSLYRIPQHTVILMECDDLPPGYTRLNLMSPSNNTIVRSSCVTKNNEMYISSAIFRDKHLQLLKTSNAYFHSSVSHGPCSSNIKKQFFEADTVICLRSHHWPTTALPWIQRCRQQGWPSEIVLSDILSAGFFVVPIGHTPNHGEEWRISFSKAEQKLVYSMNHCQFLCYGLLKMFLKEAINSKTNNPVLCSYFMKTIVFWVIQISNSSTWKPNNTLFYFWKCFKLLVYWVRIGECPNFFIPQNNLFRMKVAGSVQTSLFIQLYDLYCKGIPCLLLCPTLRSYLSQAILYKTLRVCTHESSIISNTELDISFIKEIEPLDIYRTFVDFAVHINQIMRLKKERLTSYQTVTLQCMTSRLFRYPAHQIKNSLSQDKNRTVYYKTRKVLALLKLSCTIGCVSDKLYSAIYFYRTRRYEHSLSILQDAQERMSVPYILYKNNVNNDMYEQFTTGMSLDKKFRSVVMFDILLYSSFTYIDELVSEQEISIKNGRYVFCIPPLVMLHMLFILNHHRLGDTVKSQQFLQDLQTLLLYDDGVNVPIFLRDISWQILGICQQITVDYSGSLQSFQYSLQQYPTHKIQEATLLRMNTPPHGVM